MVGTHARTITSNIVSGRDGKKDGKDESDARSISIIKKDAQWKRGYRRI